MQHTAGYQDEINEYLLSPLAAPRSVLHFWKCNIGKYPILSRIARDILAVQVSSVQPEREFSVAGNLITEIPNKLGPLAARSSLCLRSWYKNEIFQADAEKCFVGMEVD